MDPLPITEGKQPFFQWKSTNPAYLLWYTRSVQGGQTLPMHWDLGKPTLQEQDRKYSVLDGATYLRMYSSFITDPMCSRVQSPLKVPRTDIILVDKMSAGSAVRWQKISYPTWNPMYVLLRNPYKIHQYAAFVPLYAGGKIILATWLSSCLATFGLRGANASVGRSTRLLLGLITTGRVLSR